MIMRGLAGWCDDAHPAPARQWMYCLTGRWQLEAGGETVTVSAGEAILVEDTTGPGHASRCLEDSVVAVVRLQP
jgi:quercetin dioxygenase-like cupin family protein